MIDHLSNIYYSIGMCFVLEIYSFSVCEDRLLNKKWFELKLFLFLKINKNISKKNSLVLKKKSFASSVKNFIVAK